MRLNLKLILVLISLYSNESFAQYSTNRGLWAKEFSKDECLFKSKHYVISEILGGYSININKVEMEALTAAKSGELTTIYYKSEQINKEGLVLGFFGTRWNESGVIYQSYAFKNLPSDTAIEIMSKLNNAIDENSKFLNDPYDKKNIYFKYDDLSFIIYNDMGINIRVFWNDFDATWDFKSFEKTMKRFNKKMK